MKYCIMSMTLENSDPPKNIETIWKNSDPPKHWDYLKTQWSDSPTQWNYLKKIVNLETLRLCGKIVTLLNIKIIWNKIVTLIDKKIIRKNSDPPQHWDYSEKKIVTSSILGFFGKYSEPPEHWDYLGKKLSLRKDVRRSINIIFLYEQYFTEIA